MVLRIGRFGLPPILAYLYGFYNPVGDAIVVTIMQYIQSVMATASDDSAQATMIAILDSQLRVQNEIATAQVLVTTSGPNATSAAERVTSLVSTQEVLERERQQISQTITAISIENTIIPTIAQSTNEAQPNSSSTSVASPNHIDCSNSIDFGQIMTCLISTGEETKAHTFSANGDDRVLITMVRRSNTLEPAFNVFNSDGQPISGCNANSATVAEVACVLPSAGAYTIQAADRSRSNAGQYDIYLQRLNSPGYAQAIRFGEVFTGTISVIGQRDTYTFEVIDDDIVILSMVRRTDLIEPALEVFNPRGQPVTGCNANDRLIAEVSCELRSAGKYIVQVVDRNRVNSGQYEFFIQKLNSPGNARNLNYGETITSSIQSVARRNSYTFSANVDEKVVVTMTRKTDTIEPAFQVYDPNGRPVPGCNANHPTIAEVTCTLRSAGVYTIQTIDRNRVNSGRYELRLSKQSS